MRATSAEITAAAATNGEGQPDATTRLLDAMLDRIAAERDACEKLPDPELARRAGRNVLAAVACAADAIIANANLLQSAPEKLAAFLEKSAAGYVAAIEGLHKRAVLTDAAAGGRAADPRRDYPVWGPPRTS
jgi:hypothetical protein